MKKIASILLFLSAAASAQARLSSAARDAFMRHDFEAAMPLLQRLADAGNGDALGNIGNMYANGWGVEKDAVEALKYWRRAADRHVPESFGNIGDCYMFGKCGVVADKSMASSWYTKAAEHRHISSMVTLSSLYNQGMGVPKDKVRAIAWSELARMNAPSVPEQGMAIAVRLQAYDGASKKEINAAMKLGKELVPVIDANIRFYKSAASASRAAADGR